MIAILCTLISFLSPFLDSLHRISLNVDSIESSLYIEPNLYAPQINHQKRVNRFDRLSCTCWIYGPARWLIKRSKAWTLWPKKEALSNQLRESHPPPIPVYSRTVEYPIDIARFDRPHSEYASRHDLHLLLARTPNIIVSSSFRNQLRLPVVTRNLLIQCLFCPTAPALTRIRAMQSKESCSPQTE